MWFALPSISTLSCVRKVRTPILPIEFEFKSKIRSLLFLREGHTGPSMGGPLVDRRQLLKRLHKAWRDFRESHAGLSETLMMKSGVTGNWSVRDILAHVTTWEEEALKHLPLVIKGVRGPRYSVKYGGIDAFN